MKRNTWLSLILLLFSVHNVFATNCKNDIKLIFDEGEAKCLSEFPSFFKFYKLESHKIDLRFFKSKQTISFAGVTNKQCGSIWGASWDSSTPKGNDREAISWCKKYQTTNCTCSIIFSADAPLGAVKVKIPRDEFIGIFQDVQVEQALNAIEDAKQNKLEKELKKPAEEPKAPEKAQQELKLAQELNEIEVTKAKAQQELKEIEEAKAKAQQELKIAQDAQAREDAISEAKAKAQQELKLAQEAEARAAALEKLKQEEYEKEKQNAAAKARVLEEIKAEAYAKERAILEAKAKAQADLKAEEIAKQKAEEQAKAQAVIDEKKRVAAAKAAEAQAKKNREQEIAEEKRKIAESQKKIEELKNKPLEIGNSKLDKPLPNSNITNNEVKNNESSKLLEASPPIQNESSNIARNIKLEKTKQNCLKVNGYGADDIMAIATKYKVPLSSVNFTGAVWGKGEYGGEDCIFIFDTAKGPKQCQTLFLVSNDNGKSAFGVIAPYGNPVCF
jgi:hypothetical protein